MNESYPADEGPQTTPHDFRPILVSTPTSPTARDRPDQSVECGAGGLQPLSPTTRSFPIPKIIHLTYKTRRLPKAWQISYKAWKRFHPEWMICLWTDRDIRNFMTAYFPHELPMFNSYPKPIQRVDAWRYFALDVYGGVYCDLDHEPLRSIEPMFQGTDCEAYFTAKHLALVTNAFMASKPGAGVWKAVTAELHRAIQDPRLTLLNNHFYIMFTTGPWMLTRALKDYHSGILGLLPSVFNPSHATESTGSTNATNNTANPYFRKRESGSWHEWDSRMLEVLAPHTTAVIVVTVICSFVGLLCLLAALGYGIWWAVRKLRQQWITRHDRKAASVSTVSPARPFVGGVAPTYRSDAWSSPPSSYVSAVPILPLWTLPSFVNRLPADSRIITDWSSPPPIRA